MSTNSAISTIENTDMILEADRLTPQIVLNSGEIELFRASLMNIREEMIDNPYIEETLRVLPVGGFRSAIGSFWNAVVDDLRNKILYRSIKLFNKEMSKRVERYEDFQDNVNDEILIDGAYKIGVIDWEACKVLKQAKETRHIFDGHPRSSNPSAIKALSMIDDCIKYVLSQEYPPEIIDIDEYIELMGTEEFTRNEYSVSDAINDLPDIYKGELMNRLFSSYINDRCSSILRANIEFVAPFLWRVLPRTVQGQIAKRVEQEILKANASKIEYSFKFINIVGGRKYLSSNSKKYLLGPIIQTLNENLDVFRVENECVSKLEEYAGYIPRELIYEYVRGLTRTYVGHIGGSAYWNRTNFYADVAATIIPNMFEKFDDESADAFVQVIKEDERLRSRIRNTDKLDRLRSLGKIVVQRVSDKYRNKDFLDMLCDEERAKDLLKIINQKPKS